MISIILVSHSRKLAEGLMELLRQVAPKGVQIAQASGIGESFTEIGTDAVHIAETIQAVFSPDGVLVLMDLGSAILSAEMALELLPEEMRGRICFCPAPFVEGALAAAVQAGLESDLQIICRESQKGLEAKMAQLSSPAVQSQEPTRANSATSGAETLELCATIHNRHGLHLRPAARFVQAAARFQAEIHVWNQSANAGPAPAKSINALAMLNVRQGDEIRITASGAEADRAIRALREMIDQNFGEGVADLSALAESAAPPADEKPMQPQEAGPGKYSGLPISSGVAIAPLYRLKREIIALDNSPAEDPEAEWKQLEQAFQQVKGNLLERQAALQKRLGDKDAFILNAHRLILEDPELVRQVHLRITQGGIRAAPAWVEAIRQLEERYRGLADPVLKQRAVDIEDVGKQVLAALAGKTIRVENPGSAPTIVYAEELTPSETAQLDMSRIAGLITASGATTSHSAILARALGIPAVSGIDLSTNNISDGTLLALDGDMGLVWIEPPAEIRARYEARRQSWEAEHAAWLAGSHEPAMLKNGRRIEIMANIGSADEAKLAVAQGAEGVGLLRTEFLFLSRQQAPAEEEQVAALRAIGKALEGRPIIVRTLDAGGDKDLPYLNSTGEANPFLGVRAIRLSLRHPALFQAQLRAILRAASEYPLRIMFPMIANLRDLHLALEQLENAHAVLSEECLPHRWPIETGIMIEVPSAALLSDRFTPLVDFFSVGTNDLTQYTLAADRGNRRLAEYNDALHPAVLNLIQQVVMNGKRFGKRVGICGELAGDPQAVPVLAGLGLDEFSLNPAAIPRIKEMIRAVDESSAVHLAESALQMESAASVREAAQNYLKKAG